jgi:hypothetical protein
MPALPWTRLADPEPDRTYVVLASRLPLRGYRSIPAFLRASRAVRRQLAATEGVLGYSLDAKPIAKTFWTLSAWESDEMLRRFSHADPHGSQISDIRPYILATTFVQWTAAGSELPPKWADARRRVAASRRAAGPAGRP